MNRNSYFIFLILLILGIFLRLHNLSPNKIYPDVYQNLIVAENIKNYHSITGFLGKEGMFYPPYFMWSRPVFPLLINLLQILTHNPLLSARFITVLTSIFALPLSYLLAKTIFKSKEYGLSALLLTALSFNHTVWSGLLLTEPVGVFFMLLFLIVLIYRINDPFPLSDPQDILLGVLFGILIFTRYEYVVIILLVLILLIFSSPTPYKRIISFGQTAVLTILIIFTQLFPVYNTLIVIKNQTADFLSRLFILIPFVIIGIVLYIFRNRSPIRYFHNRLTIHYSLFTIFLWGAVILLEILAILHITTLFGFGVSGLQDFISDDPLLIVFFLIGVSLMPNHLSIKQSNNNAILFFVISSMFLLYLMYHHVNPAMERYMTHLLPFMLIPASYGFVQVFTFLRPVTRILTLASRNTNPLKNLVSKFHYQESNVSSQTNNSLFITIALYVLIIALPMYQTVITYRGLRDWGDRSWFSISYDEKSARTVDEKSKGEDILLLTSLPEPYYFYTHKSTQSVSDTYPFVELDRSSPNRVVWVIEDMGMRDLFPHFTNFLEKKFKGLIIATYWEHIPYHFGARSLSETAPVTIYRTTVSDLENQIKGAHNRKEI